MLAVFSVYVLIEATPALAENVSFDMSWQCGDCSQSVGKPYCMICRPWLHAANGSKYTSTNGFVCSEENSGRYQTHCLAFWEEINRASFYPFENAEPTSYDNRYMVELKLLDWTCDNPSDPLSGLCHVDYMIGIRNSRDQLILQDRVHRLSKPFVTANLFGSRLERNMSYIVEKVPR